MTWDALSASGREREDEGKEMRSEESEVRRNMKRKTKRRGRKGVEEEKKRD